MLNAGSHEQSLQVPDRFAHAQAMQEQQIAI